MSRRFSRSVLACGTALVVGSASVLPATAWAQDEASAAAAPDAAEGEIVVTAQFREQRLQDTPIAITAITGETLAARGQTSVADLGASAPNVNLSEASGIQGNAISAFIRGIGQEAASFALEPGVGIYIDDIYYGTTFGAVMDLTDLQRVEILRGPQGTLAGKNSLGGAIKLFSMRPDDNSGGFVEATYGSFDRMDARASANFTVAEDLFARFSAVANHRDGYFKNLDYGCVNPGGGIPADHPSDDCVIGKEGGKDLLALRGALRYAPSGSPLEINIVADVSRDDSGVVPAKLAAAANPSVRSYVAADPFAGVPFDNRFLTGPKDYTNYADGSAAGNYTTLFGFPYQVAPGVFTDEQQNSANAWGVAGTIEYALSDALQLISITGYREAEGVTVADVDGSPLNIIKIRMDHSHRQFTQELRLTGSVNDLVDYTVGGFFYDANDREQFRVQIPTFLYDFLTNDPATNRSVAGFAHVEVHPMPDLTLIGGLRYTDDKKTYSFSRHNPDGTPVGTIVPPGSPLPLNFLVIGLDGLSSTFAGDRLDYRAGANYRFSDGFMAYAQVSTGYKGGGVNPQPFVPDQVAPFDPETLTTYEVGFKSDFLDRRVRLNAAVFRSYYDNIQRVVYFCPDSASTACGQTKNVADARYTGVELETVLRPIDGLTIEGSLAYLDAEYTDIIDVNSLVTLDMRPPFASEWQASASVQYQIDLNSSGTITPRADWSYLSDFYYQAVISPYALIPGRNLFNARITYETEDGNWSVSASATNLTDEYYYTAAADNLASLGNASVFVGRPREFALTVTRRF
ncbi:TonB-dependent receptor [Tsuneonella sp. HG222]